MLIVKKILNNPPTPDVEKKLLSPRLKNNTIKKIEIKLDRETMADFKHVKRNIIKKTNPKKPISSKVAIKILPFSVGALYGMSKYSSLIISICSGFEAIPKPMPLQNLCKILS
jgi:hypothetical protein